MKLSAVLLALAAFGAPASVRADNSPLAVPAPPNMRAIMLAEYHFAPPAAKPGTAAAAPASAEVKPVPAGVIQMPAMIVEEKRSHDAELTAALQGQHEAAQQQAILDNLGIGVKQVTVGQHFGVGAVTVFHIPVVLLAGFSW